MLLQEYCTRFTVYKVRRQSPECRVQGLWNMRGIANSILIPEQWFHSTTNGRLTLSSSRSPSSSSTRIDLSWSIPNCVKHPGLQKLADVACCLPITCWDVFFEWSMSRLTSRTLKTTRFANTQDMATEKPTGTSNKDVWSSMSALYIKYESRKKGSYRTNNPNEEASCISCANSLKKIN